MRFSLIPSSLPLSRKNMHSPLCQGPTPLGTPSPGPHPPIPALVPPDPQYNLAVWMNLDLRKSPYQIGKGEMCVKLSTSSSADEIIFISPQSYGVRNYSLSFYIYLSLVRSLYVSLSLYP